MKNLKLSFSDILRPPMYVTYYSGGDVAYHTNSTVKYWK